MTCHFGTFWRGTASRHQTTCVYNSLITASLYTASALYSMPSAIVLYQIRPFVCPSRCGIVFKRMHTVWWGSILVFTARRYA